MTRSTYWAFRVRRDGVVPFGARRLVCGSSATVGTLAKILRKHSHGHRYAGRSSQPSAAGAHRARLVPESVLVDTHQRDRERPELKLAQIERPQARLKRRRRAGCALEARCVEHDD